MWLTRGGGHKRAGEPAIPPGRLPDAHVEPSVVEGPPVQDRDNWWPSGIGARGAAPWLQRDLTQRDWIDRGNERRWRVKPPALVDQRRIHHGAVLRREGRVDQRGNQGVFERELVALAAHDARPVGVFVAEEVPRDVRVTGLARAAPFEEVAHLVG